VITVAKLSDWINTLEPEEMIGIDEGGQSLVVLDSRAYYEIGGMPKENNERSKPCECGSPVDACVSAEGSDVCVDRAEFIKNGKPDGMTKDAASHIKLRNRIEIVQWREIGDDEDTLSISVFAATDSSNLLDECLVLLCYKRRGPQKGQQESCRRS
jgi:hypothetical protein